MSSRASGRPGIEGLRERVAALATGRDVPRRTLPPDLYTDTGILALECEHVLRTQWQCVAHVDEVAEPGDFITLTLLDEPLLVVRGDDRRVRVLSNVCRHRSNLVAQGRGRRRRFACGYHGWVYGRDGALQHAPLMDGVEGFDPRECALHEFASEVWQGFVFVDLSGEAAPLGPTLTPMDERLAGRDVGARKLVHRATEHWDTNWKCLVENFLEGYHLAYTHPRTLEPFTATSLCRKFPGGERFTGYFAHYNEANLAGTVYEQGAGEHERYSVLFCVYPSFLITVGPRYGFFLIARPDGVGRLELSWGALAPPAFVDDPATAGYVALIDRVNNEDRAKLERVQVGLRSRHWTSAPLAPVDLEGTITDFHHHLAMRLHPALSGGVSLD